MKIVLVLLLFFVIPYLLLALLKKGMTRKWFSLVTVLIYGSLFFLISIMFLERYSIGIGVFMFIGMIIGGYPMAYLLFPTLHKKVFSK